MPPSNNNEVNGTCCNGVVTISVEVGDNNNNNNNTSNAVDNGRPEAIKDNELQSLLSRSSSSSWENNSNNNNNTATAQYRVIDVDGESLYKDNRNNKGGMDMPFKHAGISLSPRMYETLQMFRHTLDSPRLKAGTALVALIGIPLIAYGSLFPAFSVRNYIIAIWAAWDGLLSISSLLVMACSFAGAFLYVELAQSIQSTPNKNTTPAHATSEDIFVNGNGSNGATPSSDTYSCNGGSGGISSPANKLLHDCSDTNGISNLLVAKVKAYAFSTRQRLFHSIAFGILLIFLILLGAIGPYSLVYPSWLWHPLLWGRYHVYSVDEVLPAMAHVCQDRADLCLNDREWEVLSAGALSRRNYQDVNAVKTGQMYAKDKSIVINVLARNIKENIPALKINVESLSPLFKEVALVVYENDSEDGTREAFKQWRDEIKHKNFFVDIMECEGVVDCKYQREYRDNVQGDYDYSPSIGEMHNYRNKAVQYIINDAKFKDFSHLLVLDVDLAVPFSPLGILHTLGSKHDHAVASSGRQPWPTAFGGFTTPYDLNGFREYNTKQTMGLEHWHRRFCGIMPAGERWHSECDALAPTHLVAILWNDRKIIDGDLYRVRSAFNGAVLYPTELLRSTGAMYDSGDPNGVDFGQRCEHVGFHDAIAKSKPMYVNRKWDMHLMPNYPGGAAWGRAQKITNRITGKPRLMLTVLITHVVTVGIFVWATFVLGVYAVQPLVSHLLKKLKQAQRARRNNKTRIATEADAELKTGRKINV